MHKDPPARDPERIPPDARADDALWRALFDTALDCIISMDHTGRVLALNRAAEGTFGWPRDMAIGRELAELIIPHRLRDAHHAGLQRYLESGVGPVLGSRIEVPALHADGHEFPVELAISRLPTAGPPVFVAYLRDIGARVRLERLRTVRAEAMQAIACADGIDAATDGVLQAFCSLMDWELGFAWQRDADTMRCSNSYEATPGAKPGFVEASHSIHLPSGRGLPGMAWESGAAVWRRDVSAAANFPRAAMALLDGVRAGVACPVTLDREVIGAIEFYSENIRELEPDLVETLAIVSAQLGQTWQRHRTETALREAHQRKDEFLAMLAHELRNPLAPISTALQILDLPHASEGMHEDARQIIGRQVEHLVRLVDDLLDVSRFIGGKVTLRPERTDLERVVSRAIEVARPTLKARDHDFVVRLPSTPIMLEVDEVRVTQAIGNLLTNAARYTPPGGRVVLEADADARTVQVRVSDTGIGIDASMLDKVFDMFVQADHDGASTHGGLGIGLTLARQLVRLHGGDLTASSGGPGHGSVFLLTLPRTDRAAAQASPEVDATAIAPIDVLVVDDNQDAAGSMALLLQLFNHNVRTCNDGASALAAAAEHRPELVLLDLGMPGMDGFEVARRLRAEPGAPLVIVALSGWGQASDRDRTAEAGFDLHLVKPIAAGELERLLDDVAAGRFTRDGDRTTAAG